MPAARPSQVVTLALEGMSYGEIGDVLGIAESNVEPASRAPARCCARGSREGPWNLTPSSGRGAGNGRAATSFRPACSSEWSARPGTFATRATARFGDRHHGRWASAWALISRRSIVVAFAIGVWFCIAIAWAMSIGLRGDVLRPSAATTAAFLDLSIRRCQGRLRGLAAQCVLYVLILTFDLVSNYHTRQRRAR